jgi:hypothetical protein
VIFANGIFSHLLLTLFRWRVWRLDFAQFIGKWDDFHKWRVFWRSESATRIYTPPISFLHFLGAGSGGSIWIQARNLSGSGTIASNGGRQGSVSRRSTTLGGGGSGGRIALYYNTMSPTVTVTAYGGQVLTLEILKIFNFAQVEFSMFKVFEIGW